MYTASVAENAEEPVYTVSLRGSAGCLGTEKGHDWHSKSVFITPLHQGQKDDT